MPVDRRKGLQAAERLLKQGKLEAALAELQRVSDSAPDDLLTLNRLGDLLARQGRPDEAIQYYRKIAEQFAEGGFIPKSVAIHKKILRIDPNNLDSLVSIGDLYLSQNVPGEARNYLLHAAGQQLEAQNFEQARELYEKLVGAEPAEPRYRIRLAELLAAEGHADRAGSEMLRIARALLQDGSPQEAEKLFVRAAEFVPDSVDPFLGACECLVADSREDEALARLEERLSAGSAPAPLVGELAWHYDRAGRSEEALKLIVKTEVLEVSHRTWLKLFGAYVERDEVQKLWAGLDPVLETCETKDASKLAEFLRHLDAVEERGHLPALERLYNLEQRRGETEAIAGALESLVSAYRARSMTKEAARMAERLRKLTPEAVVAPAEAPVAAASPGPAPAATRPRPSGSPGRPSGDLPIEAEAPAVPLNRSDEEFVAGRLTQAEVLEKYGLRPQALEQIESVTAKFPGHVEAQRARVGFVRAEGPPDRLAPALAQLALALRAAGDNDGALEAAAEAAAGPLGDEFRTVLERCRLLEGDGDPVPTPPAAADTPSVAIVVDSDPEVPVASFEPDPGPGETPDAGQTPAGAIRLAEGPESPVEQTAFSAPQPAAPVREVMREEAIPTLGGGTDIVFDLDAESTPEPSPNKPLPKAPRADAQTPSTRVPGADMLEEIEGYVTSGALDEARHRISALRTLGYAGEALDALSERIESPAEVPEAPEVPAATVDNVELESLAAVLEAELLEDEQDSQPLVPEEDPEQSIDEVFSSFKAAVQEQVGAEEHGTHYDLAIAYKGMGLVDEAISEFEIAAASPEYHRQACTMIGLCEWERGEFEQATAWYRKAIEAARTEKEPDESVCRLRYDLAEVMLQAGDREQALVEFREVLLHDSSYREVRARVAELEAQLQP